MSSRILPFFEHQQIHTPPRNDNLIEFELLFFYIDVFISVLVHKVQRCEKFHRRTQVAFGESRTVVSPGLCVSVTGRPIIGGKYQLNATTQIHHVENIILVSQLLNCSPISQFPESLHAVSVYKNIRILDDLVPLAVAVSVSHDNG